MLAVILALAGCGKGKPSGSDCERYADRVASLTALGYEPDQVEAIRKRVHNLSIDVCNGGTVTADQISCVMKADTRDDLHRCEGAKAVDEVPPPPPKGNPIEDRARAGVAELTAVYVAFNTAIGKDRCGKEDALQAAVTANADHIKKAHDAFADPEVMKAFLAMGPDPALKAAFTTWTQSQIDGTCKVHVDIETIQSILPGMR